MFVAKYFVGAIFNRELISPENIADILIKYFGPIDFVSDVFSYDHSSYYHKEMGTQLQKVFFSFTELVNVEKVPGHKIKTNKIEQENFSKEGNRYVNLDPGYLTLSKMILMTTKDYQHRVYLSEGIFAEPTYFFKDKVLNHYGWTYPDYCREDYKAYFLMLRKQLLELRSKGNLSSLLLS